MAARALGILSGTSRDWTGSSGARASGVQTGMCVVLGSGWRRTHRGGGRPAAGAPWKLKMYQVRWLLACASVAGGFPYGHVHDSGGQ